MVLPNFKANAIAIPVHPHISEQRGTYDITPVLSYLLKYSPVFYWLSYAEARQVTVWP